MYRYYFNLCKGSEKQGTYATGNQKAAIQQFSILVRYARCPMPDARCPMPDSRFPLIKRAPHVTEKGYKCKFSISPRASNLSASSLGCGRKFYIYTKRQLSLLRSSYSV
ncbi:hypothetical protein QUB75_16930 [Microcoleus sp. K1-B6]|uniref:hypothetical protein n=1 Tax=unclassified Microcoleus TaxID=2642155 RepID=UPI002FD07DD1